MKSLFLLFCGYLGFVAVIGTIPGILSLIMLYKRARARIRVDVAYPIFENSPPGRLFLTVSVTPGPKPIRITSVEAVGSELACTAPLSMPPKSAAGRSADTPPVAGPLPVEWLVPSREEVDSKLSAALLISNRNKSSLSSIQLVVKWETVSNMRLKYTRTTTIPITLKTAANERISRPYAEASI